MPAYDFKCTQCSAVFEVRRSHSDDSPVSCPTCGGSAKQVFHPVGVHFKGDGFFNTDSRPSAVSDGAPCPSADAGCDGCAAAS